MSLSDYKMGAGLAASDMHRAREFYEGKLGLSVSIDSADNVQYRCAEGSVLHVYLSPEHAGKSTATLASWGVDDIERVVDELTERGVTSEQYDEPGLKTDEVKKISAWAAILFAPAPLIGAIYGMNFEFMPELHWTLGYPFALLLMVLSSLSLYTIFKRRGWL